MKYINAYELVMVQPMTYQVGQLSFPIRKYTSRWNGMISSILPNEPKPKRAVNQHFNLPKRLDELAKVPLEAWAHRS
jgi:hypothetical protein